MYHILHMVRYVHQLKYDQVCKVYRSHLVQIGLWETNHLALLLIAVACLHI